jgi:hypothetical protein
MIDRKADRGRATGTGWSSGFVGIRFGWAAALVAGLIGVTTVATAEGIDVRWSDERRAAVNVSIAGRDEFVMQCTRSGFEARVRYESTVCRRRQAWFDRCGDTSTEMRGLRYDAVTDRFTLTSDRWGDAQLPENREIADGAEAVRAVTSLLNRDLGELGWIADGRRYYLRVRAVWECKGEYNELLARIPYVLTFGLVRVSGVDSGSFDFNLDGQSSR